MRVLLVDDSLEFLEVVSRFLATNPRIKIVGCALSGAEAVQQVKRLKPSLVLMDMAMPGMNGLEATRLIKAEPDPPRVVMVSLHDNDEYQAASRSFGADGFVSKSDLVFTLVPLIETLLDEQAERSSAGD
jgi:DNA-binding NarL/FixJ family response regulator